MDDDNYRSSEDEDYNPDAGKKRRSGGAVARRSRRGAFVLDDAEVAAAAAEEEEVAEEAEAVRKKQKVDDLWAMLNEDADAPPKPAKEAAPVAKRTMKEVKDFAGEAIVVEKEVVVGSREEKKLEAKARGGLDSVLASLQAQKSKMSTIDKSRMD